MPLDANGTYRHNDESAAFHSKAAGKEMPKKESAPKEGDGDGQHVEIHSHGDGTFHTMHAGEKMEHPTHGHALIHAAKMHAEEGHKHFHAHHDGEMLHSHSASSEQEPESRDHEDTAGAHQHMDEAMGQPGEMQPPAEEEQQQPAGAGLGGLY